MIQPGRERWIPGKVGTLVARGVLAVVAIWTLPLTSIWVILGQGGVSQWFQLCLGGVAGVLALGTWTPRHRAPVGREPTAVVLRVLALLGAALWFTEAWLGVNWAAGWVMWGGLLLWTAFLLVYAAMGWNPVAYIQGRLGGGNE